MPARDSAVIEAPAAGAARHDGPWLQHDAAGTLRQKAHLRQGQLDGPLSLFDEHGRPTLEEQYAQGKREGSRRIFVAGQLHTVAQFRDGLQHGETRIHHAPSGTLAAILPFRHGTLDGQASYFDQEGNLARKSLYREGKLHGETTLFYPDGAVMATEPYTADLLDGESKWFSAQGDVVKRTLFIQGKPASLTPAAPPNSTPSPAPKRTLTIKPR